MSKRCMLDVIVEQESGGKKRFDEELTKLKRLIDRRCDQQSEHKPCWFQIEEQFLEVKDSFITWQAFKASLDIYREEV